MNVKTASTEVQWKQLIEYLGQECELLHRLLRLSHRQARYLVKGQTARSALAIQTTDATLQELTAVNAERQGLLAEMGIEHKGQKGLKVALSMADDSSRERIEFLGTALARVTERLGRKNVQNYQLSRFSLDLVGEEMRLLLGASEGSGTTYDAEGGAAEASLSGAVDGRA